MSIKRTDDSTFNLWLQRQNMVINVSASYLVDKPGVRSRSSNAEKPSRLGITSYICSRQTRQQAGEMAASSMFRAPPKIDSLATE